MLKIIDYPSWGTLLAPRQVRDLQKQYVSHVLLFSGTRTIYMAGTLLSGDVKARVQNRYWEGFAL